MSREIFASFFHVDHDTLVKGGEDLLQGEGEIGASLFAAAAGISALHAHLATFDQRANGIFRSHASSTAFMQELARLREHGKQLKQTLLRPAAHKRMVQEFEEVERRSDQLLDEVTAVARRIVELERLLDVSPLIIQPP
jgi:chromosome segregation protein